MRILKRIAWSVAVIGVIILMIRPAFIVYEWIAWHVLTKEFQAVCTQPRELTGDDVDHFLAIEGPYTQEFLATLPNAYSSNPKDFDPSWFMWRDDGTLRVPIGFDFMPSEEDRLTYLHYDRRPRERSHVLAAMAAYKLYERRIANGADFSAFDRYAYTIFPESNAPTIKPHTCGVMQELITVGGALATENTDAGERP